MVAEDNDNGDGRGGGKKKTVTVVGGASSCVCIRNEMSSTCGLWADDCIKALIIVAWLGGQGQGTETGTGKGMAGRLDVAGGADVKAVYLHQPQHNVTVGCRVAVD